MSPIRYFILLPLICVFSCNAATKAQQEITDLFSNYRSAVLQGDGKAAWALIDSQTGIFYSQIVKDALHLPRQDFDRLDWVQKLTIARLRLEFRKPLLEKLSGKDLFVLAITNGWISRATVENLKTFERVAVSGNKASAFLKEAPYTPAFNFIREGDQWKFSLWRVFAPANVAMEQMRKQKGESERDFLVNTLAAVSKYKVEEKIFDGPIE